MADSVKNMSKVTLKSYLLTEIFLQKKEMSSFVCNLTQKEVTEPSGVGSR